MAKRIVWSPRALSDAPEIYDYWNLRNKSKAYGRKLKALFEGSALLLSQHTEIGATTKLEGVRMRVVRDYSIFYRDLPEAIEILRIWDNRRDPESLSL